MTIGTTRKLAHYVAQVQYEDLPDDVKDGTMRAVIDCVGNMIGGSVIEHRQPFMKMARVTGGGVREATVIRQSDKVSMTAAAFGNGALSTMIDFCDGTSSAYGHNSIWPGAIVVPAAFVASEASGSSGKTFLASVVAGYESATRITHSMDIDTPHQADINSRGTTVLGAAAAAGRAMELSPDQMVSALGMAGIYCPVPAGYRFYADEGLTPRADITHGWAWMSMTGVFAAQSAAEGLKMLQEQNILDGARGLWRMVGMNVFKPETITDELGTKFYIPNFATKKYPGCIFTHSAIVGAQQILKDHSIDLENIERIVVTTNRRDTIGFEDRNITNLVDRMFSHPEQISIGLVAGEPGPNWYSDKVVENPLRRELSDRIFTAFDEECDVARLERKPLTKLTIDTKDFRTFSCRVEVVPRLYSLGEIEEKFRANVGQALGRERAMKILDQIYKLPEAENLNALIQEINS